jgi:hypothetical protein
MSRETAIGMNNGLASGLPAGAPEIAVTPGAVFNPAAAFDDDDTAPEATSSVCNLEKPSL